ncbi:MAG: hypothetical protein Q9225_003407 [Loekoesia sp. 1 TL-2023]
MTLTRAEDAIFSNVRDLLEMLADAGSSELIKKFLKLNGLVKCLHKGAEEDVELLESLFDQFKEVITSEKAKKRKELADKRALSAEEDKKNDHHSAKRVKIGHDSVGEAQKKTVGNSEYYSSNRPSETSLDPETQGESTRVELAAPPTKTAAYPAGRPSPGGLQEPAASYNNRSTALQPPIARAGSSETNDGNESHKSKSSPIAARSRSSSNASENSSIDTIVLNTETSAPLAELPGITVASPKRSPAVALVELPAIETPRVTKETAVSNPGFSSNTITQAETGAPNHSKEHKIQAGGPLLHATTSTETQPIRSVPNLSLVTQSQKASEQVATSSNKKRDVVQQLESQIIERVWPRFSSQFNAVRRVHNIDEIMTMFERLNFYTVQYRILTFAERRLKTPGFKAKITELQDDSDPVAVFHAIEASSATESDAKLHKVYGQIRLFTAVQGKCNKGYKPKEAELLPGTMKIEYPKYFLSDMADSMTQGEPKDVKERTWNKLRREYYAGKRWLETMKTLGGQGVVFIFVFANVSSHAITHTYTDFQRECIKFIFAQLHSITRLVGCFENEALDSFCRIGRIDEATMGRIRECEGPITDSVDQEDNVEVD